MRSSYDLTGNLLDRRYQINGLIGKGGMGQVYDATHVALDQRVAIKVLHPRYAYEQRFRDRFIREARAASKIKHRNVVQITDFGETPDDSVFFVMEYLDGHDLGVELRRVGVMKWPRVRHILLQAVGALRAAHANDIIHRDIKPANCFLTTDKEDDVADLVKLLDFGIAKVGRGSHDRLTGTGEVFGTATYMSPEQARGVKLDHRSDMYSLGVMAYQMLTGRVPFEGMTPIHVIGRHLKDEPTPLRQIDDTIPTEVEAVVLQTLAKKPEDRYASMDELEQALRAIPGAGGRRSARRTAVWAGRGALRSAEGSRPSAEGSRPSAEGGSQRTPDVVSDGSSSSATERTAVVSPPRALGKRRPVNKRTFSKPSAPPLARAGNGGASAVSSEPREGGFAPRGSSDSSSSPTPTPPPSRAPAQSPWDSGAGAFSCAITRRRRALPKSPLRAPPPRAGAPSLVAAVAPSPVPSSSDSATPSGSAPVGSAPATLGSGSPVPVSVPEVGSMPIPSDPNPSVPPPGLPSYGTIHPPPPFGELVTWTSGSSGTGPIITMGDPSAETRPQSMAMVEQPLVTGRLIAVVAVLVFLVGGGSALATMRVLSERAEVDESGSDATESSTSPAEVEKPKSRGSVEDAEGPNQEPRSRRDRGEPLHPEVTEKVSDRPEVGDAELGVTGPALEDGGEEIVLVDDEDEDEAETVETGSAETNSVETNSAETNSVETNSVETNKPEASDANKPSRPSHESEACKEHRARATAAYERRAWSAVVRHAKKRRCWPSGEQGRRLNMLVRALLEQGRFIDCVKAGMRSKDAAVRGMVSVCERKAGT